MFYVNGGDRQHREDRVYWVRRSCFLLPLCFVAVAVCSGRGKGVCWLEVCGTC